MQLHFPSLVVGVAAAAVLLVSMSQTTPSSGPPRIEYGPNPRDMVQIKEGTPYTVPVGKLFVLTGLGSTDVPGPSGVYAYFQVNGQIEAAGGVVSYNAGLSVFSSVAPCPPGLTVPAGSTITVTESLLSGHARAWGYLANQ